MKLLLFDIDGTILLTHGAGRRAVEASLSALLDRPIQTNPVSFSGKTDPQILREVMEANGVATDEVEARLDEAQAAYAEAMRTSLDPERVELLPGVTPLIEQLSSRDNVQLGLVTGNLEAMAYLKLEAVGLDGYFAFGAFGSDSADRNALPPIAIDRARSHSGRTYAGRQVVVIGDTEHDIRCTRAVGGFAVAVCTGHFGRDVLGAHDPDVLLDDLCDHTIFFEQILG